VKRRSKPPVAKPNLQYTAGALVQNPDIDRIRLRHRFGTRHRSRIPYQILLYLYPILAQPSPRTAPKKPAVPPAPSDPPREGQD
jgi:hypothetical protein